MTVLEKHQPRAEKLIEAHHNLKSANELFKLSMETFLIELIKDRFPEITKFECIYYPEETVFGCDWDSGPTNEELNRFLDEMNKQYKLYKM